MTILIFGTASKGTSFLDSQGTYIRIHMSLIVSCLPDLGWLYPSLPACNDHAFHHHSLIALLTWCQRVVIFTFQVPAIFTNSARLVVSPALSKHGRPKALPKAFEQSFKWVLTLEFWCSRNQCRLGPVPHCFHASSLNFLRPWLHFCSMVPPLIGGNWSSNYQDLGFRV